LETTWQIHAVGMISGIEPSDLDANQHGIAEQLIFFQSHNL